MRKFQLPWFLILSCLFHPELLAQKNSGVDLLVLGNLQDAGSPHMACNKSCCAELFENPDPNRKVVSLGIIDYESEKYFIVEATPDFSVQSKILKEYAGFEHTETPDGILLTHAHIGHYTGLMYLGKEAMNAHKVPVYAMPKMKEFLSTNGPWNQLVELENIQINTLENDKEFQLSANIIIRPFLVPHRDEFSETVGFEIIGPNKKALFIPDIDKWQKWNKSIVEELEKVDFAFIDATFFDSKEISNRDISEIPHPFVVESMKLFSGLGEKEKAKVYFIHLNHSNPLLSPESIESEAVLESGFHIARLKDSFDL